MWTTAWLPVKIICPDFSATGALSPLYVSSGRSASFKFVMPVLNFESTCILELYMCIHHRTPQMFDGGCPRGSDLWVNKNRVIERRSALKNVSNVVAIVTYVILMFLLSDGDVIWLLTSLTLMLTVGSTTGFLCVLSEIYSHFSNILDHNNTVTCFRTFQFPYNYFTKTAVFYLLILSGSANSRKKQT